MEEQIAPDMVFVALTHEQVFCFSLSTHVLSSVCETRRQTVRHNPSMPHQRDGGIYRDRTQDTRCEWEFGLAKALISSLPTELSACWNQMFLIQLLSDLHLQFVSNNSLFYFSWSWNVPASTNNSSVWAL